MPLSIAMGIIENRTVAITTDIEHSRAWDISDSHGIRRLKMGFEECGRHAFGTHNGATLVARVMKDGASIAVRDAVKEDLLFSIPGKVGTRVRCLVFGTIGSETVLAFACERGEIGLWSVSQTRALGTTYESGMHKVRRMALGRLNNMDVLAVAAGATVTLMRWDEGAFSEYTYYTHNYHVGGVALTRLCGRDVVVSGGDRGEVVFVAVEADGKPNPLSEANVENFVFDLAVLGRTLVVAHGRGLVCLETQ
jgi:hypothetical protein